MHNDRSMMIFKTPLGWAGVAASAQGITRIVLPKKAKVEAERELHAGTKQIPARPKGDLLERTVRLLQDYFSGSLVSFDLALDLRYYTSFQQAVWRATAEIPFGEKRSYAWIAQRIKNPAAVRAVGQALGANPVPIVIPCHRVISSSGALGGFSGGVGMKKKLLDLESRIQDRG